MEIEWHAFELHPGVPPEGMAIPWDPARIAQGRASFVRLANEAGLEVGERTHWYNSDLAHEASLWARDRGVQNQLHRAILRAYFVENRNIGSAEVLIDVAFSLGIDVADLTVALAERRYRQKVLDEYAEARAIGVTAVPTFVVDGYAIVGAHPYESFQRLLAAVGEPRRATE